MRARAASSPPGWLDAPLALARRRGGPAQLLVRRGGETLADARFGVGADALFWPFSVSKLWLATLIWALHDDGLLDVDEPVAAYWPAFAAEAPGASEKARITVREVLQHRSGLPRVGGTLAEVASMTDWGRATGNIARATPTRMPAGAQVRRPSYEWLAWGFMLAEVAFGATGERELQSLLRDRILRPLGLDSTFATLPRTERWRAVPFRATEPTASVTAAVLNRERVRRATIPAGGVWTQAGDLAALLEAVAPGHDGLALGLRAETVRQLLTPSNEGEFDRYAGSHTWWSNGYQLGHPGPDLMRASAFGRRSSERAYGHNGSNASMAWHDPERDLTFVYLSGILSPFPANRRWLMRLEDAVLAGADGT
ncbi:serine hydrolase domain-containing protein [Gulosibacter sp. ACHW.36C]|uniref:Beta-lactamase family protein n=1 Tax=Gulosibacter sediminis TaxID=1729695 RepID=A0ABY4N0E4_9MICO|nr:serine hydrolase domain-containing protein [Gulosibacter sediminis]UQN14713.1 beta-lactamase family protein [Gulosibacter sediminis]